MSALELFIQDGETVTKIWPEEGQESSRFRGTILLKPGQQLLIASPYGVKGSIKIDRDVGSQPQETTM